VRIQGLVRSNNWGGDKVAMCTSHVPYPRGDYTRRSGGRASSNVRKSTRAFLPGCSYWEGIDGATEAKGNIAEEDKPYVEKAARSSVSFFCSKRPILEEGFEPLWEKNWKGNAGWFSGLNQSNTRWTS